MNATPYVTCSAVYYSMKSLVAPDVPANDGCYRPLTVHIPPDTILSPPLAAPLVGGNHETSQRVVDACFKALAQAIPERVTAGGPTTAGLLIFGTRQEGRWRILYEVHGGGEGAGAARDGGHAMRVHMSNVMNTPIEVVETEYPIEILEQALRPGSGGRAPTAAAWASRGRTGCSRTRRSRPCSSAGSSPRGARSAAPPARRTASRSRATRCRAT